MVYFMTTAWLLSATLAITASLLILLYFYTARNYMYWKQKGVPYLDPLPLVGNFWNVCSGKAPIGVELGNLYKKFDGPYFGIYVLDKPYLVLRSPELIKKILIKDFRVFSNRNFGADPKADPMAANSLFIMKNPDWKALRIQLTPVFTSGKMKMMLPIMNESGLDLQEYVGKHVGANFIEMKEVCAKYTTDLIASCAFGIQAKSFEIENSEFRQVGKRMFNFTFQRGLQLFSYFFAPKLVEIFKVKFLDTVSAAFLQSVFMETIRLRKDCKNKRNDFVDILMNVRNDTSAGFKFGKN